MVKITPLIQLTLKRNDKILFILKKNHAFKLKVNSSARVKICSSPSSCPTGNFYRKKMPNWIAVIAILKLFQMGNLTVKCEII